jgi:DNA-binding response OmpR family regulator
VVRELKPGADDYITKPFSPSELAAGIRALFRCIDADRDHNDTSDADPPIRVGVLRQTDEARRSRPSKGTPSA